MFLAKKGSRIGKAITVQYQRKVYKAPTRHNDKIRGGKTKKQIRTGSTKEDTWYHICCTHRAPRENFVFDYDGSIERSLKVRTMQGKFEAHISEDSHNTIVVRARPL